MYRACAALEPYDEVVNMIVGVRAVIELTRTEGPNA